MMRVRVTVAGEVVQELDAEQDLTIGRSSKCDISVKDTQVSARHARIRVDGDRLMLADLGSTNGTTLDGERLTPEVELPFERGSKAAIGPAILEVIHLEKPASSFSSVLGEERTVAVGVGQQQELLVLLARFRASKPRLVIAAEHDRRIVPIEEIEVVVGRDAEAQVVIPHHSVSSKHARIDFQDGGFRVKDLDSSNGTQVDGEPVDSTTVLPRQAAVTFGTVDCLFVCDPGEQGAEGGVEGRHQQALANHAATLGKATTHQAQQALAEHRDTGITVGEVFVRDGIMRPQDWTAMWKRREDIAILAPAAGGSAPMRWMIAVIAVLVLAVVVLLITNLL